MLGDGTKIQYQDIRAPNQITVTGYLSAAGKLHTFEEKIATNKNDDEINDSNRPADKLQSVLWNHIKLGSQHLDEWADLFSMNSTDLHTTI